MKAFSGRELVFIKDDREPAAEVEVKSGISGKNRSADAGLEQLKVFQDRGIVVVVIDMKDLEAIAAGQNLISLLRTRYESVRLDIR